MNSYKNVNLVGNTYGKLKVIEMVGKYKGCYNAKVRCECGKEYFVPIYDLLHHRRMSCKKCFEQPNSKHNMTGSRLFNIWSTMINRCYCTTSNSYKRYGARGIEICDEWKNDFLSFYEWSINNGYRDDLSIDRINNDGNYEPINCRWVDKKTQSNNRSTNHYLTYKGETKTIAEWSEIFDLKHSTISRRIKSGWSTEMALETPLIFGRRSKKEISEWRKKYETVQYLN